LVVWAVEGAKEGKKITKKGDKKKTYTRLLKKRDGETHHHLRVNNAKGALKQRKLGGGGLTQAKKLKKCRKLKRKISNFLRGKQTRNTSEGHRAGKN